MIDVFSGYGDGLYVLFRFILRTETPPVPPLHEGTSPPT